MKRRVSLSVNFDNPSARVYRRLGFHEIGSDEDSWIMVLEAEPRLLLRPAGSAVSPRAAGMSA